MKLLVEAMSKCGKCEQNCTKSQHSLKCNLCEQWLHKDCIEGMTKVYYENVVKTHKLLGTLAFFCKTCCKMVAKVTKGQKEMEVRLKKVEKENEEMKVTLESVQTKLRMFEGGLKQVENDLDKAKVEVREEVRSELKEKEAREENIVIYGLDESEKVDAKERIKDDKDKVSELCGQIEVQVEEEDKEVKFRAGKKREDGKARPLIVRVKEAEKKERILMNASKLARKNGWKNVFVGSDLSKKQREEDKKKEN